MAATAPAGRDAHGIAQAAPDASGAAKPVCVSERGAALAPAARVEQTECSQSGTRSGGRAACTAEALCDCCQRLRRSKGGKERVCMN